MDVQHVFFLLLSINILGMVVCGAAVWKHIYRGTPVDNALMVLPYSSSIYYAARFAYLILYNLTDNNLPQLGFLAINTISDLSAGTTTIIYATLSLIRLRALSGAFLDAHRAMLARRFILAIGLLLNGAVSVTNFLRILYPETFPPARWIPIARYSYLAWNLGIAFFELGVTAVLLAVLRRSAHFRTTTLAGGVASHAPGATALGRVNSGRGPALPDVAESKEMGEHQVQIAVPAETGSGHMTKTMAATVQAKQMSLMRKYKSWMYFAVALFFVSIPLAVIFGITSNVYLAVTMASYAYSFQIYYLVILTWTVRKIYGDNA